MQHPTWLCEPREDMYYYTLAKCVILSCWFLNRMKFQNTPIWNGIAHEGIVLYLTDRRFEEFSKKMIKSKASNIAPFKA